MFLVLVNELFRYVRAITVPTQFQHRELSLFFETQTSSTSKTLSIDGLDKK